MKPEELKAIRVKTLIERARDLFHNWSESPLYEPMDEDLAISLVLKIEAFATAIRNEALEEAAEEAHHEKLRWNNE